MRSLISLVLLLLAVSPASGQTGRAALAAGTERYLLADYHGALPLLAKGLDPKGGPPDQRWRLGVERLGDVLLVLRQDSLAATWLRWATRLDPEFAVDADRVPPAVVRAAAAARAFVDSTPADPFVTRTAFEWPAVIRGDAPGTIRLAAVNVPITARVGPDQFLRGGESRPVPPGSYDVVVSAPGYLPTRLTVEILPGIPTVLAVSLLPETAGLLYVVSRPWGTLLVDGERIGYTGVAAHRIAPGRHVLRLQLDDGGVTDTTIMVAERHRVRVSWVARQDTTGVAQIDSAFARLDAGEVELGAELLRDLLASAQPVLTTAVEAQALARLAAATWSLGAKDTARAYLRKVIQADPFYWPPSDLFNPALQAAYVQVRGQTPAIGLRAPLDTVVTPSRDSVPVRVAVGQPGDVRLFLRLTTPRPRDSLLTALRVDSVATIRISLIAPDGGALLPGFYLLDGEVVSRAGGRGGSARALLQIAIERLPIDTTLHPAPQPAASLRPETRRRGASSRTILEGLGLGALTVMIPVAVNDGDLSGRSVPVAAAVIGGSVALANITFNFNRPAVPVPENVAYNDSLRARWQEQNATIAAGNATKLRLASLRVRAVEGP